jgi:DNA mismatch repair protein MutH
LERNIAIEKLQTLNGQDLHHLAQKYEITVNKNGKINKGWAGHVIERFLGLPINSAQSPNFGSWELKSIPLNRKKNGELRFKETMAITMIDDYHVKNTTFENSHLLSKLKKFVCVARTVGSNYDQPTFIHSVVPFDLTDELYEEVKDDYNIIRDCILDPSRGFNALSGSMGKYIQPRTKGAGNGSTSRAFYARPLFLAQFIDLKESK